MQKTPIGVIRGVFSVIDSCPKPSKFSEPENNYSNIENQKSEKQKLAVKFEDKIFTKNEKFGVKKPHHSKIEPCPIILGQNNLRSIKYMFYESTPKTHPNPKSFQNEEAKKQLLLHLTKIC